MGRKGRHEVLRVVFSVLNRLQARSSVGVDVVGIGGGGKWECRIAADPYDQIF